MHNVYTCSWTPLMESALPADLNGLPPAIGIFFRSDGLFLLPNPNHPLFGGCSWNQSVSGHVQRLACSKIARTHTHTQMSFFDVRHWNTSMTSWLWAASCGATVPCASNVSASLSSSPRVSSYFLTALPAVLPNKPISPFRKIKKSNCRKRGSSSGRGSSDCSKITCRVRVVVGA